MKIKFSISFKKQLNFTLSLQKSFTLQTNFLNEIIIRMVNKIKSCLKQIKSYFKSKIKMKFQAPVISDV